MRLIGVICSESSHNRRGLRNDFIVLALPGVVSTGRRAAVRLQVA
jgi:hypothetical protein